MDVPGLEKEIADTIRGILAAKGLDGSHVDVKTSTKRTTVKMPIKPQGAIGEVPMVEWPKARVNLFKMKMTVNFADPDMDQTT